MSIVEIVRQCFAIIPEVHLSDLTNFYFLIFNQLKHSFWIPCARGFIDLPGNVLGIDFYALSCLIPFNITDVQEYIFELFEYSVVKKDSLFQTYVPI